jgi:hypothetical protein
MGTGVNRGAGPYGAGGHGQTDDRKVIGAEAHWA